MSTPSGLFSAARRSYLGGRYEPIAASWDASFSVRYLESNVIWKVINTFHRNQISSCGIFFQVNS